MDSYFSLFHDEIRSPILPSSSLFISGRRKNPQVYQIHLPRLFVISWRKLEKYKNSAYENMVHERRRVAMSLGFWILIPIFTPLQCTTCSRCGSNTPLTFNYCSFCGNMLHPEWGWAYASKICSKCKNRIQMSAKFCSECGHKQ